MADIAYFETKKCLSLTIDGILGDSYTFKKGVPCPVARKEDIEIFKSDPRLMKVGNPNEVRDIINRSKSQEPKRTFHTMSYDPGQKLQSSKITGLEDLTLEEDEELFVPEDMKAEDTDADALYCKICDRHFKNKGGFLSHMRVKHRND